MANILLGFQIFIIILLVGSVLLQKTGADGLSGLSGGGHNAFSGRSVTTSLSKTTMILGILFMLNSVAIAKLYVSENIEAKTIIESVDEEKETPIAE